MCISLDNYVQLKHIRKNEKKVRTMSPEKNLTRAREIYTPGATATGLFINLDRSRNMFVLRLLCGARGWLSTFDVSDDELDAYKVGSPVTALVDRVESDADGNINVVLLRELPAASPEAETSATSATAAPADATNVHSACQPIQLPLVVSTRQDQLLSGWVRLEALEDLVDALIAVDSRGKVQLLLEQICGSWGFTESINELHRKIGVLRLSDDVVQELSSLSFTEGSGRSRFEGKLVRGTGSLSDLDEWGEWIDDRFAALQSDADRRQKIALADLDANLLVELTLIEQIHSLRPLM